MEPFDAEKRIAQYVQCRDLIAKIKERQEQELKPYTQLLEQISAKIQQFMDTNNVVNVKSKAGTAHFTSKQTASLADPDAFMQFVISNSKFDLLDRRANATAVRAFVEETKTLPPGCNINTIRTLGVRRPSGK